MDTERIRLLYVDDVQESLDSFEDIFEDDYTVFTAISGKEGLQVLDSHEVHVVLSDQIMPEMTGVEFLEQAGKKYPDTVRILITGYSDLEAVIIAINQCNVFGYLHKPWKLDQMNHMLERACEVYTIRQQNRDLIAHLDAKVKARTTEIEMQKKQLARKNEQLERLNDEKSTLMGILAHDLRNPIFQLTSATYLLKKEGETNSSQLETLGHMHDTLERMNLLVSRILDVEAADQEEVQVNWAEVPVIPLIEDVMSAFESKTKQRGIQTILAADSKETTVLADPMFLRQIIENLFSNAVKYSPDNAQVVIAVEDDQDAHVVSIADQGKGISPIMKDRLFNKYAPLGSAPAPGETSTGLGLTIVKRYADAMAAEVICDSQLGNGSTFTVRFQKEPIDMPH